MPTGPKRQPIQVHCRACLAARATSESAICPTWRVSQRARPPKIPLPPPPTLPLLREAACPDTTCEDDAHASRPASVSLVRTQIVLLAMGTALAGLYTLVLRKSVLNWGATDQETSARLPGDELLEHADGVSTRAIDIDAPTAAVWPWLAQMGPAPRGGAYTYDWIENLLGLNMHSTDGVLPEFQHPEVGETFSLGSNRMRMDRVESERVLAWRSEDGNWVWTFVLEPRDGGTRLISRNRFRLANLVARIGMLPMEPGSLVMERKMLRGIKERAEHLSSETLSRPT